MTVQRACALAGALVCALAVGASWPAGPVRAQGVARPPVLHLPPAALAVERDTASRIAGVHLAALPARERAAWEAYARRSRARSAHDHAVAAAEWRAAGRTGWAPAPWTHDFTLEPYMTGAWFASAAARRLADNIITFQTPSGGWSKHADIAAGPRRPGEAYNGESTRWQYVGTFDNDATTTQLRILGGVYAAHPARRYRRAFLRGLAYVADAQFPNGCWPQVYPLQGGYHDEATFNDDAMRNILALLRDVQDGRFPLVPVAERARAGTMLRHGLDCVIASQVVERGAPAVWGQQHDPITLAPAPARSFEPASLSAQESAHLVDFLMRLPDPDARIVRAVAGAAAWLRARALYGFTYRGQQLRRHPGAGPLWARLYELGSGRPIFSDRNGVRLYDWNRLRDRRRGYNWFTAAPDTTLRTYASWARHHPPTGAPHE